MGKDEETKTSLTSPTRQRGSIVPKCLVTLVKLGCSRGTGSNLEDNVVGTTMVLEL